MKKKIMAIFTLLAVVAMLIPAGVVRAAEEYKTFVKGADENFKIIDADSTDGNRTVIVEGNDTAASRYVKALVYGYAKERMGGQDDVSYLCDGPASGCEADAIGYLKDSLNTTHFQGAQEVYLKDGAQGYSVEMLTKEVAEGLFFDGTQTTAALESVKAHLTGLGADSFDGLWTLTLDGNDAWAVLWDGGTVRMEKVARDNAGTKHLAYLPILEVDKTMACNTEPTGTDPEPSEPEAPAHCYICGEADPAWYLDSEVPEGCDLTELEQAECNPDTGVTDYILPITIAVCAAAIALTVITKQDLFKKI